MWNSTYHCLSFGEIFRTVGISRGHYEDRLLEIIGRVEVSNCVCTFLLKNYDVTLSRMHPLNF